MGLPVILAIELDPMAPLYLVIGLLIGIVGSIMVMRIFGKQKIATAQQEAVRIIEKSRNEAEVIVKRAEVDAKAEFIQRMEEFEKKSAAIRDELKEQERRLEKRADNLDKKLDTLVTKERALEQAEQKLGNREASLAQKETQLAEALDQQRAQLLRITSLSIDEARNLLLNQIRHEVEHDAAEIV